MRNTRRACFAFALGAATSLALSLGPARADAGEDCRLRSGEPAIVACSAWIREKPDAYEAYFWRGIEYAERAMYDRAIADYSKAIDIWPAYVDALRARAFAYNATGKRDLALQDLHRAAELKPDDPNIQRALRDDGGPAPK